MEHRQLFATMSAFIAVANAGSFSLAAKQLKLSQPSVSRMVSELEADLGVRLFQRSTRKLSLTEAGIIYLDKAQKIRQDVIEAKQSINGFKQTPSGKLRIGAPLHWVDLFIAPFISEFLNTYPAIQLEIVATDQHQDMVKDSLDVVLRVGDPKHVSYIAVPIKPVKLLLCASPDYLQRFGTPKSMPQLNNHNCLTYAGMNHWQYLENNELQQIKVNGNVDSNLVTVLISSAVQGLGLVLLPDLIISTQIKDKQLTPVMQDYCWSIKHATVENMYALYSDRKHLAAKTRAFIDFFKEKIRAA